MALGFSIGRLAYGNATGRRRAHPCDRSASWLANARPRRPGSAGRARRAISVHSIARASSISKRPTSDGAHAGQQLQRLGRLHAADDADQRGEHAHGRAGDVLERPRRAGTRRRSRASVGRARVVDRELAVEADRRAGDQWARAGDAGRVDRLAGARSCRCSRPRRRPRRRAPASAARRRVPAARRRARRVDGCDRTARADSRLRQADAARGRARSGAAGWSGRPRRRRRS